MKRRRSVPALYSVVQAVVRAHFLAKPVFVPFISRKDALGVAFYFSAQERYRQAGRSAPDPAEFVDLLCHNSIQFCERLSGWVK